MLICCTLTSPGACLLRLSHQPNPSLLCVGAHEHPNAAAHVTATFQLPKLPCLALSSIPLQAAKRSFSDLTIGPVLTWSTERILGHIDACLKIPGAKLAFGGKPVEV